MHLFFCIIRINYEKRQSSSSYLSVLLSDRLSVLMEQLRLCRTDVCESRIWKLLSEYVDIIQIWLKSGKNNGHFTQSPSKKCYRIHKTGQNKKRSHKERTEDLWNTRRETQIQTKLGQPPQKNGQHQTPKTRPQL